MSTQHRQMAGGKWEELSLSEQMANTGAEVGRCIKWKQKDKEELARNAFYRALELVDLTIKANNKPARYKELTRIRECLVDYFLGENIYGSTAESWNNYFYPYNYAARKDR